MTLETYIKHLNIFNWGNSDRIGTGYYADNYD